MQSESSSPFYKYTSSRLKYLIYEQILLEKGRTCVQKHWVRTISTRNIPEYLCCLAFQSRDQYVLDEEKVIKTNAGIILFYKGNSIAN